MLVDTTSAIKVIKCIEKISHRKFVIHGSIRKTSILTPKRPKPKAKNKLLRQRAVYATSFVEIAIMYAVINGYPKWKLVKGKGFCLSIPKDGLLVSGGYIHVCKRKDFNWDPVVSFSKKPVRVVKVIRVPALALKVLTDTKRIATVER